MLPLVLAMMLVTFGSLEASGGEFTIVPSLSVREAYSSNYFLSVDAPESAFVTTLSPALVVTGRTERLDASVQARVDNFFYAGISSRDTLDQYYDGQFRYRPTERLSLSASASHSLNSQPDRNLETTGTVDKAGKRSTQTYTFAGESSLSEKNSVTLSYAYSKINDQNQRLSDYDTQTAVLVLNHELGSDAARTRVMVQFQYDTDRYAISTVDNYALTIGSNRSFNELWSLQVMLGGRYTESEASAANIRKTNRDWGGTGRVALSYTGDSTSGNLAASSEFQPSTSNGVSGATQRTGVQAGIRENFTPELSGNMSLSYILNRSIWQGRNVSPIDEDTLSFTTGLRYEFTKDMALDAAYQYTRIMYNNTGQVADRNFISLNFLIRYPMFL
jgi:hypothetical protein